MKKDNILHVKNKISKRKRNGGWYKEKKGKSWSENIPGGWGGGGLQVEENPRCGGVSKFGESESTIDLIRRRVFRLTIFGNWDVVGTLVF